MKYIYILIFAFAFVFPSNILFAAEKLNSNKKKLHIYLLIGQSNMAGRAEIPKKDKAEIKGCYLLNFSNKWEVAANPFNKYSTVRKHLSIQQLNPGYSFVRKMLKAQPDIQLGLVVNALGGSRIQEWEKGKKLYDEAVRRTKIAQNTGVLKGILWHQGEGNSKDPQYLQKLIVLIKNLRKDLNSENVAFVAGQINDCELINKQIAQLPEKVKNSSYASSNGLIAMDRWHFDTKSMKTLGERYAEAFLKLKDKGAEVKP